MGIKNHSKTCCFVTNLSFDKEPTVRNRLTPYITQAIKQGFQVILVSNDSKALSDIKNPLFTHILTPCESNRPNSFVKRTVFEWNEARRLLAIVNTLDANAIFLTIPSMFLLFNAGLLKSKKLYLDVRDLTWEYLSNKNFVHFFAKSLFRILANKSFKFFSSIIVTNEYEASFFKKRGFDALMYFNGVSAQQFQDLSSLPGKQSKKFTVTYVGKVGIAQNLETLIDAAEVMSNFMFNIVGYGSEFNHIKNMASSKSLYNVSFYENADWEKVLYFYQESDVLYAQLCTSFSSAMPSKLYQYISAKRFIVYGGCGQAAEKLSEFSCNTVIPPEDSRSLVNALKLAKLSCEDQLDFEGNTRKIKEQYIREINAGKVLRRCL